MNGRLDIRKNLLWAVAVIGAALMQTTWLDLIRLADVLPNLTLILVVYFAIVVAAAAMTAVAFWRIYVEHFRSAPSNGKLAWIMCLLAAIGYGLVGFGSYLQGDLHL